MNHEEKIKDTPVEERESIVNLKALWYCGNRRESSGMKVEGFRMGKLHTEKFT